MVYDKLSKPSWKFSKCHYDIMLFLSSCKKIFCQFLPVYLCICILGEGGGGMWRCMSMPSVTWQTQDSAFVITHTRAHTRSHRDHDDAPLSRPFNLKLNSSVSLWIKYPAHIRLVLLLGHWFIYTRFNLYQQRPTPSLKVNVGVRLKTPTCLSAW